MRLKMYQVDAFASKPFEGNPAAVLILDEWLPEAIMQNIALENNLSETAFVVKESDHYRIRWYTPAAEVALCGHATLAASSVLFNHYIPNQKTIRFNTQKRGVLTVVNKGEGSIQMDFPAEQPKELSKSIDWSKSMGANPIAVYEGRTDILLIYKDQTAIEGLNPDMSLIKALEYRGVIASAPGKDFDFVSRFFAPRFDVPEDPVTGSAHTLLTPYWSQRLNKSNLTARQLSKRGGNLSLEIEGDRVFISGYGVQYLEGYITI